MPQDVKALLVSLLRILKGFRASLRNIAADVISLRSDFGLYLGFSGAFGAPFHAV